MTAGELPRDGLTYGGTFLDCDGDGWPDLMASRHGDDAEVYLNRGKLRFVRGRDVVLPGELGDHHGLTACDLDRDGLAEVFVSVGADTGQGYAWKQLWLQRSPGRFEDVFGRDPLVADPIGRGRGALWVDLDGDRRPELLMMNYQSQARLLRQADGRWLDVTGWLPALPSVPLWRAGQPPPSPEERLRSAWVHTAVAADLDGDGRTDLVAMGRSGLSGVWRNGGGGRLHDVTCAWGLGGSFFPEVPSHAAAGDVDSDGDLDLVLVYFPQQTETRAVLSRLQLWLQEQDEAGPHFRMADSNPALEAVSGGIGLAGMGIGAVLLCDLNNDGHLDIYGLRQAVGGGPAPDLLLLGGGKGSFRPAREPGYLGGERGWDEAIWAEDLDRDGDLDLVRFAGGGSVAAAGAGIEIAENRAAYRGLTIELASERGAPHGLGARLELLLADGPVLLREIQCLAVPSSGGIPAAHFGVGDRRGPFRLRVRWAGGATQEVVLPEAGRAYRLQEGRSRADLLPAEYKPTGGAR